MRLEFETRRFSGLPVRDGPGGTLLLKLELCPHRSFGLLGSSQRLFGSTICVLWSTVAQEVELHP